MLKLAVLHKQKRGCAKYIIFIFKQAARGFTKACIGKAQSMKTPNPYVYQDNSDPAYFTAVTAKIVLWLSMVQGLLALWILILIVGIQADMASFEGLYESFSTPIVELLGWTLDVLSSILFLVSAVFFCRWLYRAAANARALGAQGMEVKPGWAVGGFFIPILNLFLPYQAVKEIWLHGAYQRDHSHSLVTKWWAAWLIGTITNRFSNRFPDDSPLLSMLTGLIGSLLLAASAYYLIQIVRQITERQAALKSISEQADESL